MTNAEIITRLIAGESLDDLGLAKCDGRVDLRGRALSGYDVGGPEEIVMFRDVALSRLDMRDARLSSWRFQNCTVRDCRFDGADCSDWWLSQSRVFDCRFVDTNLAGSAVGTWHDGRGNAWERVDFSRSYFRIGVSWVARYVDCDFTGADLAEVRFEQCAFNRCRFAGEVRDVMFDGRGISGRPPAPPLNIDFSGARFTRVEFLGVDLDGSTLPDDPDLRIVRRFPCVATWAIAALSGGGSPVERLLRDELDRRAAPLRRYGRNEDMTVLDRRDFVALGGEALAALADEIITRAEEACGVAQ